MPRNPFGDPGSGYRSGVSASAEAPFSLKNASTHQNCDYRIEFSGSTFSILENHFTAPRGYMNVNENGEKYVVIDEPKAKLVR